ncbi:MAG: response regulator [Desulfobacteraceae bacterium]|nr:response regulator [Desulfobacteraceae bacterium]
MVSEPPSKPGDHLVLIGIALTAAYWILEAFLYVLIYGDTTFVHRLLSWNVNDLAMRVLVLAFFLIFGSHAQYTIAQRKKSDEALLETEGKYRTIVESIEEGYYELDDQGLLTFVNPSLENLLGRNAEQLYGRDLRDFMNRENADAFSRAMEGVRSSGHALKALDSQIIRKDRERRFVEASISFITDKQGKSAGFRGVLRDITERKRAEILNREKQAAEAASRSKSEFLANMSHEIRTPLNSIIGLVELTLESELRPQQQEDLEVVMSASYALLSVINDILDFSKIEAGKLELDTTDLPLRSFMADILSIMAGKAHEKGLDLLYRIDPTIPDALLGDPARLRQIILNLLGNAIKFTEEGEVELSVALEGEKAEHLLLHFCVRDTGIGIAEEAQEKIFGAFDQADGSTSRKYGGTGLGLAVSAQLVGLMNGRIWVESRLERGSSFHFTAALQRDPKGQAPAEDDPALQLGGVRILVIDDNPTQREILSDTLKHWQMYPVTAADTQEGLGILKERKANGISFDLLLLDTDRGMVDGTSFIEKVRKELDSKIRVVWTVERMKNRDRSMERPTEATGILYKPIIPKELSSAIRKALGSTPTAAEESLEPKPEEKIGAAAMGDLNLLIAEDLPFNQKFITRLLDKWGFQYTVVEDGKRALDALERHSYDIVLMDVQMPEMDGLEATREIRKREKTGGAHVPIIAMTAHAMKGDRERCLDAGMDDYVSKPISSEALHKAIRNALPAAVAPERPEAPSTHALILHKDELLQAFDGELELLKEVVDIFLSDYPRLLHQIETSLRGGDADTLRRAAHDLKGMLKNFQAEEEAELAYQLEKMGKDGIFEDESRRLRRLQTGMLRVKDALSELVEG